MNPFLRRFGIILCLLTAFFVQPVRGQTGNPTTVIAVVETLPWPKAQAAVVRDAKYKQDLVILARTSAATNTLDAALRSLNHRRRLEPLPDGREVTIVESVSITGGKRAIKRERYLNAILAAISDAPLATFREFAKAQTTTISSVESNQ